MRNLDTILAASKPGDTITLERGLYTTLGCNTNPTPDGQPLKPGVKLIGQGDQTVILSIRPMDESQPDSSVILGTGDNVIENLVVDCGVTLVPKRKRNGIYCREKGNTIKGVTVLRPHGVWAPEFRESFGLCVQLDDPTSSIINCSVLEPIGNYQTMIQGHTVTGCRVIGDYRTRDELGFRVAYNIGKSKDSLLSNSFAAYVTAGVYADEPLDGVTIIDCDFQVVKHGLWLNAEQPTNPAAYQRIFRRIKYQGNSVYLDNTRAGAAGILMEHIKADGGKTTENCICDVLITENNFEVIPGTLAGDVFAVNVGSQTPPAEVSESLGISKVRFVQNQVDPRMKFRNARGCADVSGTITQSIKFDA